MQRMPRVIALAIAASVAAAACSGAQSAPSATSSPPVTNQTTVPTTTIPMTQPATETSSPTTTFIGVDPFVSPYIGSGDAVDGPGTHARVLVADGEERTYVLHVSPAGWEGTDVPLVIDLHGLSSTPETQDELSGFRAKADTEGFVVAQPQADGLLPTWLAGFDPSPDVTFLRGVIADVASHVDVGPVFVSGFSNGAGMAHRIACDAPEAVAAIGVVAGAYPDSGPCLGAVPVIAFHGVADRVVPFTGAGSLLPDILEWTASWADRGGCAEPERIDVADDVERVVWTDCESATVELYVIADGRHGWPGTTSFGRLFDSTSSISATDVMWEFFLGAAR